MFLREKAFLIFRCSCFPLWGEWILRVMRAKDERFLFLKRLRAFILHALQTSIALTSISFRQATSPRRRTPPLRQTSSATSPVSSGEPAPKGKARNGNLPVSSVEPAPEGKARDRYLPVSSGTFTRFIGRACPKGESKEWRFARFIGESLPQT